MKSDITPEVLYLVHGLNRHSKEWEGTSSGPFATFEDARKYVFQIGDRHMYNALRIVRRTISFEVLQ